MREQVRLNRRLNQSVLLVGSVVVQRSAKRKFLDAARLDVRGTFLGAGCLNVIPCAQQKWLNRSTAKPQTDSDTR